MLMLDTYILRQYADVGRYKRSQPVSDNRLLEIMTYSDYCNRDSSGAFVFFASRKNITAQESVYIGKLTSYVFSRYARYTHVDSHSKSGRTGLDNRHVYQPVFHPPRPSPRAGRTAQARLGVRAGQRGCVTVGRITQGQNIDLRISSDFRPESEVTCSV